MKIKINEKNAEKITAAIKAAEGRATARTVTLKDIENAIQRAHKVFTFKPAMPNSRMNGTRIEYDGGEKFPVSL